MNVKRYLDNYWRREVLRIVSKELALRTDDPHHDPADDDETFEELLLTLFPPDGKDNRKKDMAR